MRASAAIALLFAPALTLATEGRILPAKPFCSGEYGDALTVLRPEVRSFEASPRASYVYLVRSTATYEHISYGSGGKVRHQYIRHVQQGTAFAYRATNQQWLLATNEHVARHPEITQADNPVEGVPVGSRKVREVVQIVNDDPGRGDSSRQPLALVVADEALDVAVLASQVPLQVMPYRIGRSEALQLGNLVLVHGYPLGAFAASNTGRITGLAQRDRERNWDHEDFVVDALLNPGNSGSPVFAISCHTGELELVGIYHAGYRNAQGLNVVVSVDQFRDLLENPGAAKPRRVVEDTEPDRETLWKALSLLGPVMMPFGDRAAEARVNGDAVQFTVYESDWPLSVRVHLILRSGGELPASLASAELGYVPSFESLEPELRGTAARLEETLWRQLLAVLHYRAVEAMNRPSAGEVKAAIASNVRIRVEEQRDTLQAFDFMSEKGASAASPASAETPSSSSHSAPPGQTER